MSVAPMIEVKYYCCPTEAKPIPPPCVPKPDKCCCFKQEPWKYENENLNLFYVKNKFVNGYGYYLSTQSVDCCNPNGFIYPLNGTKAQYIKHFELIPRTCVYPK